MIKGRIAAPPLLLYVLSIFILGSLKKKNEKDKKKRQQLWFGLVCMSVCEAERRMDSVGIHRPTGGRDGVLIGGARDSDPRYD